MGARYRREISEEQMNAITSVLSKQPATKPAAWQKKVKAKAKGNKPAKKKAPNGTKPGPSNSTPKKKKKKAPPAPQEGASAKHAVGDNVQWMLLGEDKGKKTAKLLKGKITKQNPDGTYTVKGFDGKSVELKEQGLAKVTANVRRRRL